ncbi:MAG: filamentous hemagglutinin N-terminal domain-containing protein [Cyanobacteria bacterium P01_G01_bin.39]
MLKAISLLCSLSIYTVGYLHTTTRMAIATARPAIDRKALPAEHSSTSDAVLKDILCPCGTPATLDHEGSLLFLAQVTSDNTVSTQVTTNGSVAEITGGETRGDNLFHSFQDFSVPTNNEAFFNNANDIANIFSRVTGGKISNIDGLIRANGSASLFLINPAGILFGENASLDLGGSFYGSTADSILFEEVEYSATDLDSPPLLTINAPIGLNFRNNSGDIINRSVVQNNAEEIIGLEVSSGNSLALLGGDIEFEEGNLTASGGRIELGGLSQAGTVTFNDDGSFSFPKDLARADITLSNAAAISVRGKGGGDIAINARNLKLEAGDFGASSIEAGISADSTNSKAQAGNITINVTDNITVDDDSIIDNQLEPEALGNGGDVTISTDTLSLTNGARVSASTRGQGNAGSVAITATDKIYFDGEDSQGSLSGAFSRVDEKAVGNGGDITITTDTLSLTNGARVDASTEGQGNAGSVAITATDKITIDGDNSQGFSGGVVSRVNPDAVGNGGNVTVGTDSMSITNGGLVSASTRGQGNAGSVVITATDRITIDGEASQGDPSGITSQVTSGVGNGGNVTISTDTLSLTNGGAVSASTFGRGNGGNVEITATDAIIIDGEGSRIPSSASSAVLPEAIGNGGNVAISADSMSLTNGGRVSASTFGRGNGGSVEITVADQISIDGENSQGDIPSGAFSNVDSEAVGDAGNVTVTTGSLSLTNGGQVSAITFGRGNGGSVEITAADHISIDGENSRGDIPSGALSIVRPGAVGDAGGVNIVTNTLSLTNGGQANASIFGQGNAGSVEITAADHVSIDGENSQGNIPSGTFSIVGQGAVGDAGGVDIVTNTLSLTNGGQVNTSTFGQGNAGDASVNAQDSIIISGTTESNRSELAASALFNSGNGGNVNVSTNTLIIDGGTIAASNFDRLNRFPPGIGEPGDINIEANNISLSNNASINAATQSVTGDSANINLQIADNLTLDNDSLISAQALEEANGGELSIDAEFIIAFPNGSNNLIAGAEQGQGGNITINAESIFGIEERPLNEATNDIDASSEVSGLDGTIDITTPDINPIQGATELPSNLVVPQQTTEQACQSKRVATIKNGLTIKGKGGIPPAPELPLDSHNIAIEGKYTDITSATPQAIDTSQGAIQPARGIKKTENGVTLTAYRTNNSGDRLSKIQPNCGV